MCGMSKCAAISAPWVPFPAPGGAIISTRIRISSGPHPAQWLPDEASGAALARPPVARRASEASRLRLADRGRADWGFLSGCGLAGVWGAPDEPVDGDELGDVAQAGDEWDGEQQQGGDAGQVDRPDVHAGGVAERGHVVPQLVEP